MKARTVLSAPRAAAYALTDEHAAAVEKVCAEMKIGFIKVLPEQANRQIGLIFGFGGFSAPTQDCADPPEEECIIFSGLNGQTLQKTLEKLKSEGAYIPLKAVCTASNQSWTIAQLIGQLSREHNALNGGRGSEN